MKFSKKQLIDWAVSLKAKSVDCSMEFLASTDGSDNGGKALVAYTLTMMVCEEFVPPDIAGLQQLDVATLDPLKLMAEYTDEEVDNYFHRSMWDGADNHSNFGIY